MAYNSPTEAKSALMDYIYDRDEAMPDDVRELLRDYLKLPSPVKLVVEAVLLVYDRMIDCGPELRKWASDTAIMCSTYAFEPITADMAQDLNPE